MLVAENRLNGGYPYVFFDYLQLLGPLDHYSGGLGVVMADQQIRRAIKYNTVIFDTSMGNAKAVVTCKSTGKWFMITGGWGNDNVYTCMLGAATGEILSKPYERDNIKVKISQRALRYGATTFADATIMTCAVADGLREGLEKLPDQWLMDPHAEDILIASIQKHLLMYGKEYPKVEYETNFRSWLFAQNPQPYNRCESGSAVRASYAGWIARTLEEAEKLGEITAKVTHNHPEGLKGAIVVAGCIYHLRARESKGKIREYVGQYYNMNFTLDEIRNNYSLQYDCVGTVPQAIEAFLEGDSFCNVIANAISIGGDSCTIAAIAGSIAEVIYPIPQEIRGDILDRLHDCFHDSIQEAADSVFRRIHKLRKQ